MHKTVNLMMRMHETNRFTVICNQVLLPLKICVTECGDNTFIR